MKTVEKSRIRTVFPPRNGRMRWAESFIAADWGTTNSRAYLMDSGGKCVDEFEDDKGFTYDDDVLPYVKKLLKK